MFLINRTYTRVECFPGRALNLIIGPNGTGKSTIVSAICLGMAGKPSTLARATSVSFVVQSGLVSLLSCCCVGWRIRAKWS